MDLGEVQAYVACDYVMIPSWILTWPLPSSLAGSLPTSSLGLYPTGTVSNQMAHAGGIGAFQVSSIKLCHVVTVRKCAFFAVLWNSTPPEVYEPLTFWGSRGLLRPGFFLRHEYNVFGNSCGVCLCILSSVAIVLIVLNCILDIREFFGVGQLIEI